MTFDQAGYLLPAGQGESLWFLDTLMTVKAGGEQTRNAFTRIEWGAPAAFSPPLHVHQAEEEAFQDVEGELTVTCGDRIWTATAGAFVFLPQGIPHTVVVEGPTSFKGVQITPPAGFEHFVVEVGEPAAELSLPPAREPDVQKLLSPAAKYGYEIKGPRPTH
jgi:quercetin dioxygenase-like cupin family protein